MRKLELKEVVINEVDLSVAISKINNLNTLISRLFAEQSAKTELLSILAERI